MGRLEELEQRNKELSRGVVWRNVAILVSVVIIIALLVLVFILERFFPKDNKLPLASLYQDLKTIRASASIVDSPSGALQEEIKTNQKVLPTDSENDDQSSEADSNLQD